jgi:hypothetical protein
MGEAENKAKGREPMGVTAILLKPRRPTLQEDTGTAIAEDTGTAIAQ